MIGRTVSHFEILDKLGEGGMGVVYRARDTRLNRFVALKFLPARFGLRDTHDIRFLQEARAASALDHPNICTIHDVERTDDGQLFIVMACYEGETLEARLRRGPLAIDDATAIARQVALGLGRAHARGIVHRDIKPSNLFLTTDGLVKILDFGVSRLLDESGMTRTGARIGTVSYMSPEQARGEEADQRADVWALGVVIYEMLTGKLPFDGHHAAVVLRAIETQEPAPLTTARPDAPAALVETVARALRKDKTARFDDGNAIASAIAGTEITLRQTTAEPATLAGRRRPLMTIGIMALLLALVGVAGWAWYRQSGASWARNRALPAIALLAEKKEFADAVDLATEAESYIPGDPQLAQLWNTIAVRTTIDSTAPGATVEIQPYAQKTGEWQSVGTTPVRDLRLARGAYKFRLTKPGHETVVRATEVAAGTITIELPAAGAIPAGMVMIPKSADAMFIAAYGLPVPVALDDYFIQRDEVTNREYKKFLDAGGYRRRELWKHPFVKDGRTVAWEDAMALFVDKAGQPGPATWEVGVYPTGEDDLPVAGVSWFEATAYAEFAGAHLPTMHHWFRAASVAFGPMLIPLANYDPRGPIAVGRSGSMTPFGAFDMAGNVKEWCSTADAKGFRYILGGGAGEPQYMFGAAEARTPFDRSPLNGLRTAAYTTAPPMTDVFSRQQRDYTREKPVSDAMFAALLRAQQYAKSPLAAKIEKTIDSDAETRVERVTMAAAYPGERLIVYLWLPRDRPPPYQTVLLFPGSDAIRPAGPEVLERPDRFDFLVRSGRAVVHPVYAGMYERFTARANDPIAMRNQAIRWAQDARRTLDYLDTRADIDHARVAYFGASLGASMGPVILGADQRLTLAILAGGGLPMARIEPEMDTINFLPRVTVPLLLVSGRYDYLFPYETSQKPFLAFLGTPASQKSHQIFDAGHSVPRADYLKAFLGWLDKYFGPVK